MGGPLGCVWWVVSVRGASGALWRKPTLVRGSRDLPCVQVRVGAVCAVTGRSACDAAWLDLTCHEPQATSTQRLSKESKGCYCQCERGLR
jgi:hypothetical protein